MKIKTLVFLIVVISASACKSKKQLANNQKGSAQELQTMMEGSYDSSRQADADSSFYNIALHMYPVWTDKGHYLYVEQALATNPSKPYRQRIYEIIDLGDNRFSSRVYSLEDDDRFIGKWSNPEFFNEFDKSILAIREGCDVILNKDALGYSGSTVDDNCKSTMRGASYATSKVIIRKGFVESWDQGFDDKGEQVWGAVKSGYKFVENEGIQFN